MGCGHHLFLGGAVLASSEVVLPNSSYRLRLTVLAYPNVVLNTVRYDYDLVVLKTGGSGYWTSDSVSWSVRSPAGTTQASGSRAGYDFRGTDAITLGAGSVTFAGSASRVWAGHFQDDHGPVGGGSVSFSFAPPAIPATPTGLTVSRVSDAQQSLAWVNPGPAYTAVVVQRQTDDGVWQEIARPVGNAVAYSDATTAANRKYRYRVAGVAAAGTSPVSSEVTIFTSPAAPTGVVAERVSQTLIRVSAAGVPPYASLYDVRDGDTVVASGVSLPWDHPNPDPSVPHVYRVCGTIGALQGAWSEPSNTVQLQAAPNPATNLAPNGVVVNGWLPAVFSWRHNPVDSSTQSWFQIRVDYDGEGFWSPFDPVQSSVQSWSMPSPGFAGDVAWQVRTKGAHADWSDWSSTATVAFVSEPGVAVTSPAGFWAASVLSVGWSWYQAQSRPQSAWQAELRRDGELIATAEGSGAATSAVFGQRVVDGGSYVVRVRAATGGLWSAWAEQSVVVVFFPPASPVVGGVWGEDTGGVALSVRGGDPDVPVLPVVNEFTDPLFNAPGTTVEVARNLALNSRATAAGAGWNQNLGTMPVVKGATPPIPHPLGITTAAMSSTTTAGPGLASMYGIDGLDPAGSPERHLGIWVLVTEPGYRLTGAGALTWPTGEIPANEWTYVQSITPVAAGAWALLYLDKASGDASLTARAYFTGLRSGSRGPYFDGGMLPAGETPEMGLTPGWVGTVNDSPSVLTGVRPAAVVSEVGVKVIQSAHNAPDGGKAARIIPTSPSNNESYATLSVPAGARGGGTAVIGNRQDTALTGVLSATRGRPSIGNPATQSPTTLPNEAGSVEHRISYGTLASGYALTLPHGGLIGSGDVYYTEPTIVADALYTGGTFSGASGVILIDGIQRATRWESTPNASRSIADAMPTTIRVLLERSIDQGVTWERMLDLTEREANLTDWESLSHGDTWYRATAYTSEGATSEVIEVVEARSPAIWLSGGPSLSQTCRLPFDPKLTITTGRDRTLKWYAGSADAIAYAGSRLSRSIAVTGRTADHDIAAEATADTAHLEHVVQAEEPLHMLRDPDGRRVFGVVDGVSLDRQMVTVHATERWNAIWGYNLTLKEARR